MPPRANPLPAPSEAGPRHDKIALCPLNGQLTLLASLCGIPTPVCAFTGYCTDDANCGALAASVDPARFHGAIPARFRVRPD
ncbi:hypothetical protein BN2476_240245 [Paraburkholderia piptadeniae]|uniref:Uncharacterized protein n=1 Tax=Paraburkholderia piptadeniae TaxID=1701573 RepID=A0A1N7RZL7_9BURK|nr:hypothetical protein BN2476_240245 [Paraburkholderia piptadeniae]